MKFRIIEHIACDGKKQYVVEYKKLFFWRKVPHISKVYKNHTNKEDFYINFETSYAYDSIESAKCIILYFKMYLKQEYGKCCCESRVVYETK